MENFSKSDQFKLIQSISNELCTCEKRSSGLLYTIKHISNPSPRRIQNLRNEVALLKSSKLFHPNLISLLWAEETPNSFTLFYEFCTNGPLSSYFKIEPLFIFSQICQGVSYLHSKSIVHKRLNIYNIFLNNNIPKIGNFELAEKAQNLYNDESDLDSIEDYWKAPELIAGSKFSKESDIWNLGLIFYFLVYRQHCQFPLKEDPRPQYRDIFTMTLSEDPKKRASIEDLLKKVNERAIKEPPSVGCCACFPSFMTSRKSTVALLKKTLFNEIASTTNKCIERLIDKVVANPKKIGKFFLEIRKQTEEANEIVKIRACTVLFCYLKAAPLVVYNQTPGVLEVLSVFMLIKQTFRDIDKYLEVSQAFSQVIQCKFYLIRSTLPKLSGSFTLNGVSEDLKIETLKEILWYWDLLLNFHEVLSAYRNAKDFRTIRLALIEEQVNLFTLIHPKVSRLSVTPAFQPLLSNYSNNIALAKNLFKQDYIEFPEVSEEVQPLNILDDHNMPAPVQRQVALKPKSKIKSDEKFSSILLEEIEDERPGTIYGTPMRTNSLRLENEFLEMGQADVLSISLNQKINCSRIDPKKLKYLSEIGSGSSCDVWLGEYKNQKVAIKKQKSSEKNAYTEFYRELNVLVSLKHPNLIQYKGACIEQPLCIVIEYCEGGDLFKLLHRSPGVSLSWSQKLVIMQDITKGMQFLHKNSFMHRDLKSLNVLLRKVVSGEGDQIIVKISDFGLSKVLNDEEFMTGQLGTCHWMAPEVLNSVNYSFKADVYSFAILMFEVITRVTPYKGLKQEEIRTQVVNFGLRPCLESVPSDCPKALKSLMILCWSERPEDRPSFDRIADILTSVRVPNKEA